MRKFIIATALVFGAATANAGNLAPVMVEKEPVMVEKMTPKAAEPMLEKKSGSRLGSTLIVLGIVAALVAVANSN